MEYVLPQWALKTLRFISLTYALTALPAWGTPMSLNDFAVSNTNADGKVTLVSALSPGDFSSFDLTGGNTGSGLDGETDFLGIAPVGGTVRFLWAYTSCYPPNQQPPSNACDDAGVDWAGYMVDQYLTPLTDKDTGGIAVSASFQVDAGAVFGWYVGTLDNTGEPGTLSVFAISFDPAVTGNPEPGTLLLGLTGVAFLAAASRRTMKSKVEEGRKV